MDLMEALEGLDRPSIINEAIKYDKTFGDVGEKISKLILRTYSEQSGKPITSLKIKEAKDIYKNHLDDFNKREVLIDIFTKKSILSLQEQKKLLDIFIDKSLLSSLGLYAEKKVDRESYNLVRGNLSDATDSDAFVINQKNLIEFFTDKNNFYFRERLLDILRAENGDFLKEQKELYNKFMNYKKNKITTKDFFYKFFSMKFEDKEEIYSKIENVSEKIIEELKKAKEKPELSRQTIWPKKYERRFFSVDKASFLALRKKYNSAQEVVDEFDYILEGSKYKKYLKNYMKEKLEPFFKVNTSLVNSKSKESPLDKKLSKTVEKFISLRGVQNNKEFKELHKKIFIQKLEEPKKTKMRYQTADIKSGKYAIIKTSDSFSKAYLEFKKLNSKENRDKVKRELFKSISEYQKENGDFISIIMSNKSDKRIIIKKNLLWDFIENLVLLKTVFKYKSKPFVKFDKNNKIALDLEGLYRIASDKDSKAIVLSKNY